MKSANQIQPYVRELEGRRAEDGFDAQIQGEEAMSSRIKMPYTNSKNKKQKLGDDEETDDQPEVKRAVDGMDAELDVGRGAEHAIS